MIREVVPPDAGLVFRGFRTGHSVAWGHHLYVDDLDRPAGQAPGTRPGVARSAHHFARYVSR